MSSHSAQWKQSLSSPFGELSLGGTKLCLCVWVLNLAVAAGTGDAGMDNSSAGVVVHTDLSAAARLSIFHVCSLV